MHDAGAAASPAGELVAAGEVSKVGERGTGFAAALLPDVDALLALERDLLVKSPPGSDHKAHQYIFGSRFSTLGESTRRYYAALERFTDFLAAACVPLTLSLAEEPRLWEKVSSALVEAFKDWLLQEGYRISTVNRYLRVVKAHAALTHQAGLLSSDALAAIQSVKRIADQVPRDSGKQTPPGPAPVDALRVQERGRDLLALLFAVPDDSPQGRRDQVALLLLFELGIDPEEAAALHFSDLDLIHRCIRVQRETSGSLEYLELTEAQGAAITSYLQVRRDWRRYSSSSDEKTDAPLLVPSRKNTLLFEQHDLKEGQAASWSPQQLRARVRTLTRQAGLPPLASFGENGERVTCSSNYGTQEGQGVAYHRE
jgi:integrase